MALGYIYGSHIYTHIHDYHKLISTYQNAFRILQKPHSSSRTFPISSENKYQNEEMLRARFEFAFP